MTGAITNVPLRHSLLPGFPPGKTFVLYGPENDRTMGLRNLLAMWIGRSMGRYASRTQYCEVVLVQVSDREPVEYLHREQGLIKDRKSLHLLKHPIIAMGLSPVQSPSLARWSWRLPA